LGDPPPAGVRPLSLTGPSAAPVPRRRRCLGGAGGGV